jgi:hypothetical protein
VPPSLALLPGTQQRGVLCGARTRALLETLNQLASVEADRADRVGMPARIGLGCSARADLEEIAVSLGLILQRDASLSILSATPHVRDSAIWKLSEMPGSAGWAVHRFSTSRLLWQGVEPSEATQAARGLFRFELRHQRFYYLRWNGRSYSVPVQVAKYALLGPRRRVLRYARSERSLAVPVACRPPLLVERSLILCSGCLPRFGNGGYLIYEEVPPAVASLAIQLLGQEM